MTIADPPRARSEGASDAPATEDRLGFGPYVRAVAAFLLNQATRPPFTMSIEGEWGAGKSSFLAQLAEALTRPRTEQEANKAKQVEAARIIQFSPWRHEKDESLWAAFATQFVKETQPKGHLLRWWANAKLTWRQFDFAQGWMSLAFWIAVGLLWVVFTIFFLKQLLAPSLNESNGTDITLWGADIAKWSAAILGSGGSLTAFLWKVARASTQRLDAKLARYVQRPDYANKLSFLTSFHEDFTAYVKTHIAKKDRVFVLVDDLDRCEPLRAAELLKAINLMIPDKLELVFIIALDRLKVAAGIAAGQEKILPFILAASNADDSRVDPQAAISHGYEFLEKFVQLPFRLPRMGPNNVASFIASLMGQADGIPPTSPTRPTPAPTLRDVATDNPIVGKTLSDVAPVLNFNPRRLKQFLNLFRLRHYVLESAGQLRKSEPTLTQLGKVVALEIRWPRLVEDILHQPSLLQELENVALNGLQDPAMQPASAVAPGEPPSGRTRWISDEQLLAFLRSGAAADRIGTLDLGAILGAPPLAIEAAGLTAEVQQAGSLNKALGKELQATQVQTPSMSMAARTAEGGDRPPFDPTVDNS
jgi:hypothetical protein